MFRRLPLAGPATSRAALLAATLVWLAGCTPPPPPAVASQPTEAATVVAAIDASELVADPAIGPGCLSPDGSQVVYADGGRVVVVGVAEGAPRTVAEVPVRALYWDPGGRVIAETAAGAWVALDPSGGPPAALPGGPEGGIDERVVASPVGGAPATDRGGEVFVGGQSVASGLRAWGAPVWRADGKRLAIAAAAGASGPLGLLDVYQVDPASGQAQRIYATAEDDLPVGYLPDGRLLVASFFHREAIVLAGADHVVRPLGAGGDGAFPRFEPDGLHLGFTQGQPFRGAGGAPALSLQAALTTLGQDGSPSAPPVRVVPADGTMTPVYTSDGRWFLYPSHEEGSDDLWMRDAMGQNPRRLSQGGRGTSVPTLSPDDRRLVWSTQVGDGPLTAVLIGASFDPATGQIGPPAPLPVSGYRGDMQDPLFSPDGGSLLFVGAGSAPHRRAVYVMPAAGGTADAVVEFASDDLRGGASFTPDGKAVVYPAWDGGGYALYRAPLDRSAPPALLAGSAWSLSQPTVASTGVLAATAWRHGVTLALVRP